MHVGMEKNENARPERPRWQRPQLIVLTRGNPEEHVLLACKMVGSSAGPSTGDLWCITFFCGGGCSAFGTS